MMNEKQHLNQLYVLIGKYRIFLILASFSSEKILAKLVKDESKNIDTIFNKTDKLTDNEK